MKKLIGIVVLGFLLTNNAISQMKHSISKDEFKGSYFLPNTDFILRHEIFKP